MKKKKKKTAKKLYVVLIENNHTECYDIVGGVFDNKKDLNKFIKDNRLGQSADYEVDTYLLNEPAYEHLGDDDDDDFDE